MLAINSYFPASTSIFNTLNQQNKKSIFIIKPSDHFLLKGLKYMGKGAEKGVLILAFSVMAVAFPLFASIEGVIRGAVCLSKKVCSLFNQKADASSLRTNEQAAPQPVALSSEKAMPTESMVSYLFSGGRFGDCLITYLHAKWLSYKYHLPLAYVPFEYSDQLLISDIEKEYDLTKFTACHAHGDEAAFTQLSEQSQEERERRKELHSIYYFPESPSERGPFYRGAYVAIDWKDLNFKAQIREIIKPKQDLNLIVPPKDRVSVAIHWRAGSGPDNATSQNYYPCKLPPEDYYIAQAIRVCQTYADQPLYFHLFTDARNPKALQEKVLRKIREAGFKQDIIFGDDHPNRTNPVLEDFFSMSNFDCLIRSESHYSIAAQLIGNHKLVIGPKHFHSEINYGVKKMDIVIDQLAIFENGAEREEETEIRFPYILQSSPIEKYLWHHVDVFGLPKIFP
ncbi:hypothetical protein [Candidatus Protochlamydia phocaeensis]|uniref:hypothetical protein n=1 Tax=Candidatus Protochlamydia phocaeensis TaxID=1414722 RepID=UPI000837B672|nr:hypothetical protein [Candidatus Protochlamydia phocaeensis]